MLRFMSFVSSSETLLALVAYCPEQNARRTSNLKIEKKKKKKKKKNVFLFSGGWSYGGIRQDMLVASSKEASFW